MLSHQPAAVWLSFGDPTPFVPAIHAAAVSICQVTTEIEAEAAAAAGADVIVTQGSEAGGHGRSGSELPALILAVSRAVPDIPLVAAGGISDRTGFDAVHRLGAAGVAVGSGFYATHEALDVPAAKQRLVEASGDDTTRGVVYDIIRGAEWPEPYDGRFLRTELSDRWTGREAELRRNPAPVVARHRQAVAEGDMTRRVVWAGAGIDAITAIGPAAEVVARFPEVGQATSR